MIIVIADDLPPSAAALLREVDGWVVDVCAGRPRAELMDAMGAADALLVRSATTVDRALIEHSTNLKVIARAGTGVDNVDVQAATSRGILVLNAPGANSISVAEHACALMLALARSIPAADAAMKLGRWDKKAFTGAELRGKTLGIVGLGRVGQEVAHRARGFGMDIVAHDPFIAAQVAADLRVDLASLDEVCARADYLTLHMPATGETRGLFGADRFAVCKRGVRFINTARGDLVDERALADAIESGIVAGAALDVFEHEPPLDWRLARLPQVIATPHIAASTREAQELVGIETAGAVRDFLRDGIIRNAVNFPSMSGEDHRRLQPFLSLAERLGTIAATMADGRTETIGVRYYGELASGNNELLCAAVIVGVFRPILSSSITAVNARAVAESRGVEVVESRSSRPRNFTSLLSIKLHTSTGVQWLEGTVFEHDSPRLVSVNGIAVEAPLDGTLLILANHDQPGVIGAVGTILGRHNVNIASFALGRQTAEAIGIVNLDDTSGKPGQDSIERSVLDEIRAVPAVRRVWLIKLC